MSNIKLPEDLEPYAEVFGKGDVWLSSFPEKYYPRDQFPRNKLLLIHLKRLHRSILKEDLFVWKKAEDILNINVNLLHKLVQKCQSTFGYKNFFNIVDHVDSSYNDYLSYVAKLKKMNHWNNAPSKASKEIWPIVEQAVKQEVEKHKLSENFFICAVGSLSHGVFSKTSGDIDLLFVSKKITKLIRRRKPEVNKNVIAFCNDVQKKLLKLKPKDYKYNRIEWTIFDTQWYKYFRDQSLISNWPFLLKPRTYSFFPINTIASKVNRFIVGDTKFMKLFDKAGETITKKNRLFRAFLIDDIIHVINQIKSHTEGTVKKGVPLSPLSERQKSG